MQKIYIGYGTRIFYIADTVAYMSYASHRLFNHMDSSVCTKDG